MKATHAFAVNQTNLQRFPCLDFLEKIFAGPQERRKRESGGRREKLCCGWHLLQAFSGRQGAGLASVISSTKRTEIWLVQRLFQNGGRAGATSCQGERSVLGQSRRSAQPCKRAAIRAQAWRARFSKKPGLHERLSESHC